jgi:hypothetical protein
MQQLESTTTIDINRFYLYKKNEFRIEFEGNKARIFQRLPLSSKDLREIQRLQDSNTKVFDRYRLSAKYSLGITDPIVFESAIWEDDPYLVKEKDVFGLRSVLDACMMRAIHGIAYFSPELEEWLMYESKTALLKVEPEVIEAWNMFIYKQHGVMPNQWHHFYEQGDSIIYPEHIADLITVDNMWNKKLQKEREKEEQKQNNKNPLKNNKGGLGAGSGFYGQTMRFNNPK